MKTDSASNAYVAIACGGTGGHLFPGLAVAEQLKEKNCRIALLVSPKEVDQQAVQSARDVEIFTLPSVALQRGSRMAFLRGFWQSWRAAKKIFTAKTPDAVLAMGGFTGAPPVLAARSFRAQTFLHESNTIPGRANRWLARFVNHAFVGFPETASRLRAREITVTGTPVRPQFFPRDAAECRRKLGLNPDSPVALVMGGSQGASGINDLVIGALSQLAARVPHWQWLHLAGPNDSAKLQQAYAANGLAAKVLPFLAEMDLALGAATVAVSRAGASSLAELAAMRLPSLLIPFPYAADNHQLSNARAFESTGAARLLEQKTATPEKFVGNLLELVGNAALRDTMQSALVRWHSPKAAVDIARCILQSLERRQEKTLRASAGCGCGCHAASVSESKVSSGREVSSADSNRRELDQTPDYVHSA